MSFAPSSYVSEISRLREWSGKPSYFLESVIRLRLPPHGADEVIRDYWMQNSKKLVHLQEDNVEVKLPVLWRAQEVEHIPFVIRETPKLIAPKPQPKKLTIKWRTKNGRIFFKFSNNPF